MIVVVRACATVALMLATAVASAVDVYRCEDSDGAVTLSDTPCAEDQAETVLSVATGAPAGEGLRAAEQAALERMDKAMAQRRSLRAARQVAAVQAQPEPTVTAAPATPQVYLVPSHRRSFAHHRPRHTKGSQCRGCGRAASRARSGSKVYVGRTPRKHFSGLRMDPGARLGISAKINF